MQRSNFHSFHCRYICLIDEDLLASVHQPGTPPSHMLSSCWLSSTEPWPLTACTRPWPLIACFERDQRSDQLPGSRSVNSGQKRLKTRPTPRSIRVDICDGAPCNPASRYSWPRRRQTSHPIHNEQQFSNPWCFSSPLMRVWWCVPDTLVSPSMERVSVHTSYCLLMILLASPPRTLSAYTH
jgi:hypothetical protein